MFTLGVENQYSETDKGSNETPLLNVVCIINGMLRKLKTDEQSTPLNEMLIYSICLTTDSGFALRCLKI